MKNDLNIVSAKENALVLLDLSDKGNLNQGIGEGTIKGNILDLVLYDKDNLVRNILHDNM